jgi:predicted lipoprotein with Yx(FWY)xxD motif
MGAGLVALAAPAGATSSNVKTVTVSTAKVSHVGTVLTTSGGLTLYRFTEDPSGSSVCSGACAKIWPPLFAAKGSHIKGPKGVKGLSLMKVGSHWQVAFHKVALYRFEGDKKKGQAKGQNVGHVWFAVLKSGVPAAAATTTTTSAPQSTTTNPPPTTTQGSHAGTNSTPAPVPSQTPATQAPTPVTSPPTTPPTTPPTSPPTTTPTTMAGGGGYGY